MLLPCAAAISLPLVLFCSTGRDDNYLTYWAAHTLASFGTILNYNGLPVEQSSSLLHVILLALLHRITGVDIVLVAYLSAIAACFLTLFAARQLLRALGNGAIRAGEEIAVVWLVATHAYLLYWSLSGMETTLVACLVLLVATQCVLFLKGRRGLLAAGATIAAAVI